jgi:hypothetical protein
MNDTQDVAQYDASPLPEVVTSDGEFDDNSQRQRPVSNKVSYKNIITCNSETSRLAARGGKS